jgi:hypothetical protein
VTAALAFLRVNWIYAILIALLAVQTVRIEGLKIWPLSIDGLKKDLADERDGRKADRDTYAKAQAEARALNEKQVARIEKEQEAISNEISRNLTARLERLRSELRSKAAPRNPGSPQAGPDGEAPGGADGEAGLCLTSEELLRAAENEERHDQLISWIEQQLKIER